MGKPAASDRSLWSMRALGRDGLPERFEIDGVG